MSVFGGPRGGLLVLIGLSCQAQEFTQVASFPYATAVNSWQVMGKVASDKKKLRVQTPLTIILAIFVQSSPSFFVFLMVVACCRYNW